METALIGAVATILAATLGPLINWGIDVLRHKERDPTTQRKNSRRLFFVVMVFIVGGMLVTGISTYASATRFSAFANDFTPAWTESVQSNAKNDFYIAKNPNVPNALLWYKAMLGTLEETQAPQINYRSLTHYLFYRSTLNTKQYSWTGFLLWRTWVFPEITLLGKSEILFIVEALENDALEVGLKDSHGNETKISLKVVKGWAGYRIPLSEFAMIDLNRIQLFLFAHTRGVGSADANTFRVPLITTR